ncbi:histidine phosphatase family protein [Shewanella intestini]|uniref:Histidine phosphatase family protein n=1 Tax=Shewanella intestini TaxID=2017544 RepID=A0ABS5I1Q4_9GAMM|nr:MULTISPECIES: histidine phosphatase family protein [Shewanella]MBR9727947.1 histidine phosphatase family protein [Shewanella intestini]MRG36502.1 histidine phosphatase family protein [Shewanella sp. XMDDZSB0408]
MNTTEFIIMRHGLPEQADCLLGRTNPPLTTIGWQQMYRSSAALEYDLIISSPRQRCSAFAQQLAQQHQCPCELDDAWQELDFGDWDGMKIQQLWLQDELGYPQYWQQPFVYSPPNGESSQQLLSRMTRAITTLAVKHTGKRLLIISHAGVMRMALAWLLNTHQQRNPHLSRVELDHAAILRFNVFIDQDEQQWPQLQALIPAPPISISRE